MKNIDLFDEFVAGIFALLYESFPVKRSIDARGLCGHHQIDDFGGVVDDLGHPSRSFDVAKATLNWLAENGYITADASPFGVTGAVLTPRGLAALNASPGSLSAKESVGARIVRYMREGSTELAKEAAKAAVSAGVSTIV